jgi:hypothetical protein
MTPVIELISEVIKYRLESVELVDSVTRPKQINSEPCGDKKITLTQGSRTLNRELSCPGNPPAVAIDQVFVIAGELRPSEESEDSIDTFRNLFESQIRKALTTPPNWHSMDGYAIDSEIGAARKYQSDSGSAVMIDLLVRYRHSELDDTVQR